MANKNKQLRTRGQTSQQVSTETQTGANRVGGVFTCESRSTRRRKRRSAQSMRCASSQSEALIEEPTVVPEEETVARQPSVTTQMEVLDNPSKGFRILQHNCRRAGLVSTELKDLILRRGYDLMALQEPHKYKDRGTSSFTLANLGSQLNNNAVIGLGPGGDGTEEPWSAIVACKGKDEMSITRCDSLSDHLCTVVEVTAVGLPPFYVVSLYCRKRKSKDGSVPPEDRMARFIERMERVLDAIRGDPLGKRVLFCLDANARSTLWGAPEDDDRGEELVGFIRRRNLHVINDAADRTPTFVSSTGCSHIDVTLASNAMKRMIKSWEVRNDLTSSDHAVIEIELERAGLEREGTSMREQSVRNRFNTRKADWDLFKSRFTEACDDLGNSEPLNVDELDGMAEALTSAMISACEASMPRKKFHYRGNTWWKTELTRQRRRVADCKRRLRFARYQDQVRWRRAKVKYTEVYHKYRKMVLSARSEDFRRFVTDVGNQNPWGPIYRYETGKTKMSKVLSTLKTNGGQTTTMLESARLLLDTHVPDLEDGEKEEHKEIIREAGTDPETANCRYLLWRSSRRWRER